MERKINKKVENYISNFKDDIKNKIQLMGLDMNEEITLLLQFIYDYDRLTLDKEDFAKRKRIKTFVPIFDRCCAKRANGEQCTRRKTLNNDLCGTHIKGFPYGKVEPNEEVKLNTQKVEVWAQDIKGIIYYIDKFNNVYDNTDIIKNITNPKIIAKYVKDINNNYSIPEFNI